MEIDKFLMAATSLSLFETWAWCLVGVMILMAIGTILFLERRHFGRQGKAGSWLSMRLLALFLLLPLTVGVVIIPARGVSGMEALAVFYAALFLLAPLVWFAGHWLAGRLLRPAFTRGESLFMGASGLLILLLPAMAMNLAQGPIFYAKHSLTESSFQGTSAAPMPYSVGPVQRFALQGVGPVFAQSLLAPTGFVLERIDRKVGDAWLDTRNTMRTVYCRDGQNLHFFWLAGEQLPKLRFYWRQNDGRVHSDFVPANSPADATAARQFRIAFRSDGVDPPVPIPRERTAMGYFVGQEQLVYASSSSLQPGESFDNDCIMAGYKRVASEREGPPQAVALLFYPDITAPVVRVEIRRPLAGAGQ
ncbi:MAG: hypothetical protein CVU34_12165 [Betaproteobacteria bacterium HGW-Betaproteobacteria-7]|jgi:hypothetical protein|nr:MAG: hypothetical protein CVU34_12165 [Betaproteobacteria bacterium HGW-Betaproteobacteria-7]